MQGLGPVQRLALVLSSALANRVVLRGGHVGGSNETMFELVYNN